MKQITVQVSEGQHRYIQSFARALGTDSPGDFLLMMALTCIDYAESDEDGRLSVFIDARIEFLQKRRIPRIDPHDLLNAGVNTRPASEFPRRPAEIEAMAQ